MTTLFTVNDREFCTAAHAKETFGIKAGRLKKLVDANKLKRYRFPLVTGFPVYAIEELQQLNKAMSDSDLKTLTV